MTTLQSKLRIIHSNIGIGAYANPILKTAASDNPVEGRCKGTPPMSTEQNQMLDAFAKMTEAVTKVPTLEAEIERLNRLLAMTEAERDVAVNHQRDLSSRNDELSSKVRSLEVERDDLGFRNLELDEKLEAFASMAGAVLAKVRPEQVKQDQSVADPIPVPATPPYVEPTTYVSQDSVLHEGQSVVGKLGADETSVNHDTAHIGDFQSGNAQSVETKDNNLGQSESFPTNPDAQSTAPSPSIAPIGYAESSVGASNREYEGAEYWLKPGHMTWEEWISKGGKDNPFRENSTLPQPF